MGIVNLTDDSFYAASRCVDVPQVVKTVMTMLDEGGMLCEISRLLGSDTITDATLSNARELKDMAIHAKQY